jgi:ABC-2 type transport system ATP-binding protein
LSEVELITDRVGILNKGKLLREGTVKELTERKEEYKLTLSNELPELNKYADENLTITKNLDGSYSVKVDDIRTMNILVDKLRGNNILIKEIVLQKNTLEEMFISLINQEEKEDKE